MVQGAVKEVKIWSNYFIDLLNEAKRRRAVVIVIVMKN